jgi:surface antigen
LFKNWNTRVNVKARLSRHLRIVKENIWVGSPQKTNENMNFHYKIVLFFVFLVIPVYPSLASFMYNNSSYDFYRWDIDESSIIESYYWWGDAGWEQISPMLESSDSFIAVNTMLDDERDIEWTNEIVNYEVKPWDSFNSISYNFKVSTNSIFWANNFTKNYTLHPWEVIKVPPVSWLIHQVKSGESISSIAKKYDIGESKIFEQNWLEKWSKLLAWEVLVIPWAIKKAPPKPVIIPSKNNWKLLTSKWSTKWNVWTSNKKAGTSWSYALSKRSSSNSFYWGNCTWYVAQYKKVTWRWNANEWMDNARSAWKSTWSNPSVWAIVSFSGRWYNPRYGHVWIVTWIVWWEIIVSDMNYRRLNEVTTRKVSVNDRSIEWYIYVD